MVTFRIGVALGLSAIGVASYAAITTTGPFVGDLSEGFETLPTDFGVLPSPLFGGAVGATYANDQGYGGVKAFGDWSLNSSSAGWTSVVPSSGNQFLALAGYPTITSVRPSITLDFTGLAAPVRRFGGYFSDVLGADWASQVGSEAEAYTNFDLYISDGLGGQTLDSSFSINTISDLSLIHI